MTDSLRLTTELAASPERVFDAWVDGPLHGSMTGASAMSDAVVGGEFTAWDDYIMGTYVELVRPTRIVQRWRTSEFPEGAPDSRLVITLTATGSGTTLALEHTDLPAGQGEGYTRGWEDYYFAPMREFFAVGAE